jgi:hypothetical protein
MTARKPEPERVTIVKVQLPIVPFGGPALIYDKAREHRQERRLDQDEEQKMCGRMKAFFSAWWSDATGWVLLSRANDKRW